MRGKQANRVVVAVALCLNLSIGTAGSAAIGTAMAPGAFRIDNATVRGNATLFDGSVVETANAPSSLQLKNGARFSLEAESRGRLFGDRIELEKGSSKFENGGFDSGGLENGPGYHLIALGLTIRPMQAAAAGLVKFDGAGRVQVASTRGSWQVRNAQGQLIANLPSGTALSFEPQQTASDVTRVTGVLKDEGGRFLLTDEVTRVTVEVVGPGVAKEVGKRVEVFGLMDPAATSANDVSRVIRVRELRSLGKAETVASAASAGTGKAASAGTGKAASAGTGKAAATGKAVARAATQPYNTSTAAAGTAQATSTAAGVNGSATAAGAVGSATAAGTSTVAATAGTATAGTTTAAGASGAATAAGTVAATAGTATAAATAGIGAISAGTIAIVGGVAVGAVTGGLAAASAISGQNETPVSR